jgi:hypothetical protein
LSAGKRRPAGIRRRLSRSWSRARRGHVPVFNRYRRVWSCRRPDDPGERDRQLGAARAAEEAGCHADHSIGGIVEVDDGRRHFGAVFACEVATVPESICNEEIDGLALWTPAATPEPLGASDRALLTRFAGTGLPKSV